MQLVYRNGSFYLHISHRLAIITLLVKKNNIISFKTPILEIKSIKIRLFTTTKNSSKKSSQVLIQKSYFHKSRVHIRIW